MSGRRVMTLTTLGLSLRDETLVKSLLSVVAAQTRAEWRYVDEIDADLALCDPASPFMRMGIHRFEREGRPLCVALGGHHDAPGAVPLRSIRAPLRVREFMDLLDATSDPERALPAPASASASSSAAGPEARSETLVETLRACAAATRAAEQPSAWRIGIGGHRVDVLFPEGRYVASAPELTVDALVDLALSFRVETVVRLDRTETQASHPAIAARSLDLLYWRIGLRMPPEPGAPWLGDGVALRLSRWPDFGHLGGNRGHLALAALMTRTAWRPADLIETSGQSRQELHAFLGACALCGLLLVDKVVPDAAPPQAPARRLGVSGLFRSLRNALRMGD